MSSFSDASFSTDSYECLCGLSFTPNNQGPNGQGTAGSGSTATLASITVGFQFDPLGVIPPLLLFSQQLTDPSQISSSGPGYLATGTAESANGVFGPGTYAVKYTFNCSVPISSTSYLYFATDDPPPLCTNSAAPYTGGTTFDEWMDDAEVSAQFIAEFND